MAAPPVILVRERKSWSSFKVRAQPVLLSADEEFMVEYFDLFEEYVEWILADWFTRKLNYMRLALTEDMNYLLQPRIPWKTLSYGSKMFNILLKAINENIRPEIITILEDESDSPQSNFTHHF